jgi:hypothetical protein
MGKKGTPRERPGEQPLSVQQVADRCGVTRKAVENWCKRGLAADRSGARTTIRWSDVRCFPRHRTPSVMREAGLDPDATSGRGAFAAALSKLGWTGVAAFSDEQVEIIKTVLGHTPGNAARALLPAPPPLSAPIGGEAPPADVAFRSASAPVAKRRQAALDRYHSEKLRPRRLPAWFWQIAPCPPFDPPTDVFEYVVLDSRTTSPSAYPALVFHVLKVRRSAGYESTKVAPFFRRVGERIIETPGAPGDRGLAEQYEKLERASEEFRATRAEWQAAWSKRQEGGSGGSRRR